jgi:hypothetical protein
MLLNSEFPVSWKMNGKAFEFGKVERSEIKLCLNFSQKLGLVVATLSFSMGILWLMLVLELANSNINMG